MSYIYYPEARPATRNDRFPWLLFLFVSFALLVIFNWPLAIHSSVGEYNVAQEISLAGGSTLVRQLMLIALGLVAMVSLARRPADPLLRIDGPMGWLLIAFVAWSLMSVLWAQDPSLTLKRLTSFIIICVAAVAIVRRLSLREILLWTFYTTALFLVIAFTAELVSGIFQPLAFGYRFSGIHHPNTEGVECGLLLFSGVVAAHTEKKRKWVFLVVGLIGALFLILTASRTTFAATTLALSAYGATVSRGKARSMILPVLGLVGSLVFFLAMAGAFQGLEAKLFPDRDDGAGMDSLAGRSAVWEDVTPYMRERPILGYGYGGFWTQNVIDVISDKEQWPVPDGHSTYLDYALALGAVGLILNVLCLLAGLRRSLTFYQRTRDPHFAFLVGLLVFCIVDGFLESGAGEVTLLAFLLIIALARVAYLPLAQRRESGVESQSISELAREVLPGMSQNTSPNFL